MVEPTIADFVTARLAEEWQIADEADGSLGRAHGTWTVRDDRNEFVTILAKGFYTVVSNVTPETAQHMALHDPDRIKAELRFKQQILARHGTERGWTVEDEDDNEIPACTGCGDCTNPWPCRSLRELAAIWNGHPDYRAEWAPKPRRARP